MVAHFFDFGGTVIDGEYSKREALILYLEKRNIELTPEEISSLDFIEMRPKEVFEKACEMKGLEYGLAQEYEEYKEIQDGLEIKLVDGVEDYLAYLEKKNEAVYLVTNSKKTRALYNIERTPLKKYFCEENIISRDDDRTIEKKGDGPTLYQLAMKKANVDTREAIVYEDTSRGIKGALSAGITEIYGLNPSQKNEKKLVEAGATTIFVDYTQIPRDSWQYEHNT